MKELVPRLLTLLKDRRNTAKVFRDKQRGRGEWGTVEGGNKRIANKAKGVHTGDVNGDLGVAQNTAYRNPHNRVIWRGIIVDGKKINYLKIGTRCSRNVNSCRQQREIFWVQIRKEEDKTHRRSQVSHPSAITETCNYDTATPKTLVAIGLWQMKHSSTIVYKFL